MQHETAVMRASFDCLLGSSPRELLKFEYTFNLKNYKHYFFEMIHKSNNIV